MSLTNPSLEVLWNVVSYGKTMIVKYIQRHGTEILLHYHMLYVYMVFLECHVIIIVQAGTRFALLWRAEGTVIHGGPRR